MVLTGDVGARIVHPLTRSYKMAASYFKEVVPLSDDAVWKDIKMPNQPFIESPYGEFPVAAFGSGYEFKSRFTTLDMAASDRFIVWSVS